MLREPEPIGALVLEKEVVGTMVEKLSLLERIAGSPS